MVLSLHRTNLPVQKYNNQILPVSISLLYHGIYYKCFKIIYNLIKALAATNVELYKTRMLDATLKEINTTFMFVIALTVLSLVVSLFLENGKEDKIKTEQNIEKHVA